MRVRRLRHGVQCDVRCVHGSDYPPRCNAVQVDEGHLLWHNPQNQKAVKRTSRFAWTVSECGTGVSHIRKADRKSSQSRKLKKTSKRAEVVLRYQNRMMLVIQRELHEPQTARMENQSGTARIFSSLFRDEIFVFWRHECSNLYHRNSTSLRWKRAC